MRSGYEGSTHLGVILVDGEPVDIYGCFGKDTPETEYDFYDLYYDGECINLGEPLYQYPKEDDARAFMELRKALYE
jgi:hypothetical protein